MGLSSRLFLLSADDTLHTLAGTAFMRMLRRVSAAARTSTKASGINVDTDRGASVGVGM